MLPRARPHPFPATRRATLTVMALLAIHVILALVALQAAFLFVELAWRVLAGRDELRPLLATHLAQFRTLRAVQAAFWIVTALAFVAWVGRAHGNLAALGATGVRHSPPRAMAAFLIPGPNLVRPLAVLRQLWNASDPSPRPVSSRSAPARVRWWWGLLLGTVGADGVARALALRSGAALDIGPAMQALIVGQVLTVAAAVLGIAVVHGVDARQEEAAWSRGGG
jgi:hypothetical protein